MSDPRRPALSDLELRYYAIWTDILPRHPAIKAVIEGLLEYAAAMDDDAEPPTRAEDAEPEPATLPPLPESAADLPLWLFDSLAARPVRLH